MKPRLALVLLALVCLLAFAALTVWLVREDRAWENYRIEHDCQQTEEVRTIVVPAGRAPLPVRQHRWECYDGQEHWH